VRTACVGGHTVPGTQALKQARVMVWVFMVTFNAVTFSAALSVKACQLAPTRASSSL
jgi:hypothetical protein